MRRVARVAACALVAAGAGAVAEAMIERRERRRDAPPGALIDVGGHRLHIVRAGAGTPAVVLDAGLGAFSIDWSLVVPGVAGFTTVCAYDRAGYGWSDPGPGPRTSRRIAEELHTLLHASGVPTPYVLVGHSFGGFNVRVFADRYRDEVAGLVMVDASHEDEARHLPDGLRAAYRRLMRLELLAWQVGRACSALGLVRLAGALARLTGSLGLPPPIAAFKKLPPAQRRLARLLRYRPSYYAACYAEDVVFPESAEQARASRVHRAIPAAVLVATGAAGLPGGADPLPGPVQDLAQALLGQKQALARALARQLSPEARYIVADRSGHLIPLDRPDVVVDAIRQVAEAARR